MKHPTPEQWMEFHYHELPATQRREFQAHLKACAECRQQQARHSSTLKSLDAWKHQGGLRLPNLLALKFPWNTALKWAAAAMLLISSGVAASRIAAPRVDVAAIEAQVLNQTAARLRADLQRAANQAAAEALAASEAQLQKLTMALAALREQDKEAITTALKEIQAQHLSDLRALRQELETVAVLTDQSLRQTQRQLVQLSSYNQP